MELGHEQLNLAEKYLSLTQTMLRSGLSQKKNNIGRLNTKPFYRGIERKIMDFSNATMAGRHEQAHRELNIEKVENGYIVKAQFIYEYKDEKKKKCRTWKRKEFVFSEEKEVVTFVSDYLLKGGHELKYHDKKTKKKKKK